MSGILPGTHNVVTGAASATTTAATELIAAPSFGKLAITSLQLGRSDAGQAAMTVTLNDLKSTVLVVPGGPTANNGASVPIVFDTPLMWPPKTNMTFAASTGVNTL